MTCVFVPDFVRPTSAKVLFHRVELFVEMSETLAHQLCKGEDKSVELMMKLVELRPVHGFSCLNDMFSLIKDLIFEYQTARQNVHLCQSTSNHSGCGNCDHVGDHSLNNSSTMYQFSTELRDNSVIKLYRLLLFSVNTYSKFIDWLRKRRKDYVQAHQKVEELSYLLESLKHVRKEVIDKNAEKLKKQQKAIEMLKDKLKEYKKIEATTRSAFLFSFYNIKEYRKTHLEHFSNLLKVNVQQTLGKFLELSVNRLKGLKNCFLMSEDLLKRLNNFNALETASTLYETLSTKYIAAINGEDAFTLEIPEIQCEVPVFHIKEKVDLAIGFLSDSKCSPNDDSHILSLRFEELYVWGRENISSAESAELSLNKGQKVKQKLVSRDGKLAFGWVRGRFGRKKKYGFYQTSNTQFIP